MATPVVVAPPATLSAFMTEPGESNHAGGVVFDFGTELTLGPSVWYSWTDPTTGPVTLDLDLTYDFGETGAVAAGTALAVYTGGSVDGLSLVANTGADLGSEPFG